MNPLTRTLLAVFLLSGGASLGYQAVWPRLLAPGLGQEMPAVLAVLSAIMAGLGLGSWAADGRVSRSHRPGLWYAGFEFVLGLWACALIVALPFLIRMMQSALGLDPSPFRQWTVTFGFVGLLLLPASAAMGATFPAMERWVTGVAGSTRWVGAVYAANTLGSAVGVLAAAWWLLPQLGMRATTWTLAGVSLGCSVAAVLLSGRASSCSFGHPAAEGRASTGARTGLRPFSWWFAVFSAGFLGMGFEVVGIRVLSQVLENTLYTYAAVLAVYLAGIALGAAAYQRWCGSLAGEPEAEGRLLTRMLCVLGAATGGALWAMDHSPGLHAGMLELMGGGRVGFFVADSWVALVIFLPVTLLSGALFSHVAQMMKREAGGVGKASGLNTLGAALAPLVFGVWGLEALGARWAVAWIGAAFLALSLLPFASGKARGGAPMLRTLAGAALAAGAWIGDVRILEMPEGARVRVYEESALGFVAVLEEPDGHRLLRVDNRFQMGGTAAEEAQARQALIPLALHENPRTILVLGVGTGTTLGAAAATDPVEKADGVELLPAVLRLLPEFAAANRSVASAGNVRLFNADARRFVVTAPDRYDVIVSDLFHPARDGAGLLYTRDHFEAIQGRLAPGGLFCQWLPLHQLDLDSLRLVGRTFLEVFPRAQAWLLHASAGAPVLGLMNRSHPGSLLRWGAGPREPPSTAQLLRHYGIEDPIELLGLWVADEDALRDFCREGPASTDDWPGVTFWAPRLRWQPKDRPASRLMALLDHVRQRSLTGPPGIPAAWGQRLQPYLKARDVYLQGLVADLAGNETAALAHFLESARWTSEFTAGYAQCLGRATVWLKSDPARARDLLQRLVEAQPEIPVARQLLDRLDPPR